jgi:hypothetical protein
MRRIPALLLAAAVVAPGPALMARDAGAFGCNGRGRQHVAAWRLDRTADPALLHVRIGDGVRLEWPRGGRLLDVVVFGGAGLAAGTQNGVPGNPDYVYTVTATGVATVRARTTDGHELSGVLQSTC